MVVLLASLADVDRHAWDKGILLLSIVALIAGVVLVVTSPRKDRNERGFDWGWIGWMCIIAGVSGLLSFGYWPHR